MFLITLLKYEVYNYELLKLFFAAVASAEESAANSSAIQGTISPRNSESGGGGGGGRDIPGNILQSEKMQKATI